MKFSILKTIVIALSLSFFALSLIAFPQEALEASKRGLKMWWEIVFPSLLPFFIVSELLIGYGIVKFVGVLLEPLMRPLFRVPGAGGFVWAMGMASGFPAGAKLTARLRQEKQISRIEGERLVSFTNASNPLFIFGAISVGFFQNAKLGIVLAATHYLSNFCVGIIMRFFGKSSNTKDEHKKEKPSLITAIKALHQTRIKEERPFGKILGDAVLSSVQTLLMIGGFIILFSVFNKLLTLINVTSFLASIFSIFLTFVHIPTQLAEPLLSGIFEITLGNQMVSAVPEVSLLQKTIIASFILGFSGLSVHAQVASILATTDIRFKPFFYARIIQGFFAGFFTFLLWKPLYVNFNSLNNSALNVFQQDLTMSWAHQLYLYVKEVGPLFTLTALMLYIVVYSYRLYIKTE